jgi:ATP-dependent phosphofructokinase / diphosphate-dependent phosphofructokinase
MAQAKQKMGILVGGGPAPGINSVISAATICARLRNTEVLGIQDGFKWLMQGRLQVTPLDIEDVSRIHFRGGSYIGIARDNPTKDQAKLTQTIKSLLELGINRLITIGGDDTLYSAQLLEKNSDGKIHVVHVPKTIDNDLNIPHGLSTFGYQSARHHGVNIVKNLMNDALTTGRWYFIVSMGRKAGHLALGLGKSAGATLTLIPEEFGSDKITLKEITDILMGAIIKRLANGRPDGVAILAEGLVEKIDPEEFSALNEVERDDHGNIRLSEISFGDILKIAVTEKLKKYNLKSTIVSKNIGYELRCADPIPFDIAYTRDLGFMAAHHVLTGGNACMVSFQNMKFVPIPFSEMLDKNTGKSKVRMVDISSEAFRIAYAFMIRLKQSDFQESKTLKSLAKVLGLSPNEFKKHFEYLCDRTVHKEEIIQQIPFMSDPTHKKP